MLLKINQSNIILTITVLEVKTNNEKIYMKQEKKIKKALTEHFIKIYLNI